MQQYKDDLLVSCLRLVLSLPLELVRLDVVSSVAALKVRNFIAVKLQGMKWGLNGLNGLQVTEFVVFIHVLEYFLNLSHFICSIYCSYSIIRRTWL